MRNVIALFYFVGSENPCIYSVPNRKQSYAYYMKFTDRANRTHRVLYDKSLYEREMNELVARIERAKEDEE